MKKTNRFSKNESKTDLADIENDDNIVKIVVAATREILVANKEVGRIIHRVRDKMVQVVRIQSGKGSVPIQQCIQSRPHNKKKRTTVN